MSALPMNMGGDLALTINPIIISPIDPNENSDNHLNQAADHSQSRWERIKATASHVFNELHSDKNPKLKKTIMIVTKLAMIVYHLFVEIVKITIIFAALVLFVHLVLPASKMATAVVVVAPIAEEILFRGILLTGIEYTFYVKDALMGFVPSEIDERARLVFRVRVTAVVFGLAHLMNPVRSFIQVFSATLSGLSYGYFKEKTNSVVPGMMLHAINNGLVQVGAYYPILAIPCIVASYANKVIGYAWAVSPES